MSKKPNEINDNEIRIITADEAAKDGRKRRFLRIYLPIILFLILGGAVVIILAAGNKEEEIVEMPVGQEDLEEKLLLSVAPSTPAETKGFVVVQDTVIDGKGLLILWPENARPLLVIGEEALNDSTIILATQAADVRGDNGEIAGTFVLDGEVISKGEAKAGFCSIVNGDLSIGVADATPRLEQTLRKGGYFFRQYPLVVGAQIVENKPKGKSIRKALAEIGGKICVIVTKEKLTFHDFSQVLIDAGVSNAIYLVGSTSYGFYVDDKGERILIGREPEEKIENVSYIVWEQR